MERQRQYSHLNAALIWLFPSAFRQVRYTNASTLMPGKHERKFVFRQDAPDRHFVLRPIAFVERRYHDAPTGRGVQELPIRQNNASMATFSWRLKENEVSGYSAAAANALAFPQLLRCRSWKCYAKGVGIDALNESTAVHAFVRHTTELVGSIQPPPGMLAQQGIECAHRALVRAGNCHHCCRCHGQCCRRTFVECDTRIARSHTRPGRLQSGASRQKNQTPYNDCTVHGRGFGRQVAPLSTRPDQFPGRVRFLEGC